MECRGLDPSDSMIEPLSCTAAIQQNVSHLEVSVTQVADQLL